MIIYFQKTRSPRVNYWIYIYFFFNTYLVIVSAINPGGSYKRGTRRPTWALVDSQRPMYTEKARAFSHARANPVTVACSSYYDWNTLTKYNGDGTQSDIPTI